MDEPALTIGKSTLGGELLYGAAAVGMLAFTRASSRVELLGMERVPTGRGIVFVATHRSDRDVPLVCAALYLHGAGWRHPRARLEYAAREDMFAPGFAAGFPPGLPTWARRRLYGVSLARALALVKVHPLASATSIRLGEALAAAPADAPLAGLLPVEAREELARAARRAGLPAPTCPGEALRGELAEALWGAYDVHDLSAPALAPGLHARRARAIADLRRLIELVRAGVPLLIFPEGWPSPDGAIGPLRRGLGALVRRGEPDAIHPIAIAYDPLTRGRRYALVAIGAHVRPGPDVEATVLAALRRTMPLTCGQVVAGELLAAAREHRSALPLATLDAALAHAVATARAEDRAVHRALCTPVRRRARLADALRALVVAGALAPRDGPTLAIVPGRVLGDPLLNRLARERESASSR